MLVMYYVIIFFGGWINGGICIVLIVVGEKGVLMYVMGIVAVIVIDFGGLINKVVGFVVFSFIIDYVLLVIVCFIVIVILLIGLGLVIIIDCCLIGKCLFNV